MNKKCIGCGAVFQTVNQNKEGYVKEQNYESSSICERCFRIIHYNEYQMIDKNNIEFIEILKEIDKTNDLVVLVVDLLNINKNIKELLSYLHNDILLVYTKRDALPLKIKDEKFILYNDKLGINVKDTIVVSSVKNYNFDLLLSKINKYKKSKNVYVVGYSNTGKSTLINQMIYHYSNLDMKITTSMLPSTTMNIISVPLNENLTLMDTPGILEEGNISHFVDSKTLKKIIPKREIKPVTYQVKTKQFILIDDLVKVELLNKNNITIYVSNSLKITRTFKETKTDLKKNVIRVKANQDIVISGLGFIKVAYDDVITVYTIDGVDVYSRDSLI